jgi:formylglycine-generating enzyme required for sulfatase activity
VAACAPGVFPQGYVSRAEAEAACEAAGKRLCSFAEWRGACRGKHGWHHPYAARRNRGACNSAKPHLLTKLFGPDSREWHYDKHFNSPLLNQERGFLAMSGSHPDCASPFGVQDLVGNLHEWVSGEVNESFVDALDEEDVERHDQSWRVGNGIFVGGFYSTEDQLGPGCMYVTIAHEPRYHDYSTGFRCCTNAPARADPKRARQDRLGQR